MAAQKQIECDSEQKRLVQKIFLAYRRLPSKKKERVDKLAELLDQSEDSDEQTEIALAIGEILVPELVGVDKCAGNTADLEEGVSDRTKRKVDAYRMHVGTAIRQRRGELQLTQEELAKKAGIPQSHISRLEDGQHSPTAKTIERLARALETEPSKLDILYD
jgi:DNA-binding XRE family transcriptional regulator